MAVQKVALRQADAPLRALPSSYAGAGSLEPCMFSSCLLPAGAYCASVMSPKPAALLLALLLAVALTNPAGARPGECTGQGGQPEARVVTVVTDSQTRVSCRLQGLEGGNVTGCSLPDSPAVAR